MFPTRIFSPDWLRWVGATTMLVLLWQLTLSKPAVMTTLAAPPAAPMAEAVAQPDARVATDWFDLYLDLVQKTNGFTPPVAARAFGYAGVALYEAVAPGFPAHQSLVGQLNELAALPQPVAGQPYDGPTAANAALAQMARLLFAKTSAQNLAAIHALEAEWQRTTATALDSATYARSVQYGQQIANAVFAWSTTDGGHEGYLHNWGLANAGDSAENDPCHWAWIAGAMHKKRHCPENNFADADRMSVKPGQWQPTPPTYMTPLQPTWGENRPFVLARGDACPLPEPLPYAEEPTSPFYQEALEVYTTAQGLTDDQKASARFWADVQGQTATPPGHSIAIATQVLRQEQASLILAAETYAKVGIAVADAFIGCWDAKYQYNLLRPVTYIHRLIDPAWKPLLNTPPFPEYPSGHSVQSGAVATVLADLFGPAYTFVDHTHANRGLAPRTFTSFAAMAEEAALSRLYGGIHFRRAIELGLVQGECIGKQVNTLQVRH